MTLTNTNKEWISPIFQSRKTLAERFWEKVDIREEEECWEWKASKRSNGYGQFWVVTSQKIEFSHRVAWQLNTGEIPYKLDVCHTCDNPSCCNPKHLFLGTRKENLEDMVRKGRSSKGEKQGLSKVKEIDIVKIRELHETGLSAYSIWKLKTFPISEAQIRRIIKRECWAHVK